MARARKNETCLSDFPKYIAAVERLAELRDNLAAAKARLIEIERALSTPRDGELDELAAAVAAGETAIEASPDLVQEHAEITSRIRIVLRAITHATHTVDVEKNAAVRILQERLEPARRELIEQQVAAALVMAHALECESRFREQVQRDLGCFPFPGDCIKLPNFGLTESVLQLRKLATELEASIAEIPVDAAPATAAAATEATRVADPLVDAFMG